MATSATWTLQYPSGKSYTMFGEVRHGLMQEFGCIVVGIGRLASMDMIILDPRVVISHPLLGTVYTPRIYRLDLHDPDVAAWLEANPEWGMYEIKKTKERT